MDHHDHSAHTHTAKCDECDYVAQTHVHSDEEAVGALSLDLAEHNQKVHGKETDPESIKEDVKGKMQNS